MRPEDLRRLSEPYQRPVPPSDERIARALGVETAIWNQLSESIFADLTEAPPFGIAWWAPHPGTSRRLLIGDQLYACVQSVTENLIEARLHWLELQSALDRESERMADAVRLVAGQLHMEAPPPTSVWDELAGHVTRLHTAGVVTALSGALDCMSGVIIGVLGLKKGLLRADFGAVRSELRRLNNLAQPTRGEDLQSAFGRQLNGLIDDVGPEGWLEWVLALRNMLVHRGRRTTFSQFVRREPILLDARGREIIRVDVVNHLPLDPGRSEVEVALDAASLGSHRTSAGNVARSSEQLR